MAKGQSMETHRFGLPLAIRQRIGVAVAKIVLHVVRRPQFSPLGRIVIDVVVICIVSLQVTVAEEVRFFFLCLLVRVARAQKSELKGQTS